MIYNILAKVRCFLEMKKKERKENEYERKCNENEANPV